MMRSLYAGVTGLRAHQVRMDVIGNNIANVNTNAFKASRVNFADMYSAMLGSAISPSTFLGGVNPKQVGLGVGIASIDVTQTQGALQLTGKMTDMAIQGNGFFVLREGGRYLYTRSGNFDFDADGFLVNPATGQRVQGWLPDATGTFPTRDEANIVDVKIPVNDTLLAKPTTEVTFDQALNANSPIGTIHNVAFTAYDSLGREQVFTMEIEKMANNDWQVRVFDPTGVQLGTLTDPYSGAAGPTAQVLFNTDGSLFDPTPATPLTSTISYTPAGAAAMNVTLDWSRLVQPALEGDPDISTMRYVAQDGYGSSTLTNISIDNRGALTGYYSNGAFREIAQVALANFTNPGGLLKEPGNNWSASPNSGIALIGSALESGRGGIASNSLELSNVDLAAEFSNMIVTQRGFQANSRVITTADEMLQEVMNIKR